MASYIYWWTWVKLIENNSSMSKPQETRNEIHRLIVENHIFNLVLTCFDIGETYVHTFNENTQRYKDISSLQRCTICENLIRIFGIWICNLVH